MNKLQRFIKSFISEQVEEQKRKTERPKSEMEEKRQKTKFLKDIDTGQSEIITGLKTEIGDRDETRN